MSKLSKKIGAAGRAEPAPFGFASAAARPPKDSLLCGVRLGDLAAAAGAASKGADFVILENVARSKVKGVARVDASVGLAGDFDAEDLAALVKAGVDFVVLPGTGAGAAPLADESVGRVMTLDGDLDDTHLRLLSDLGLDALVIAAPDSPLTVERLLSVRRLSSLTRTPLLANANPDVDEKSLELLRDSGVAGIVLAEAGKLTTLKKRISALPPRGRRKEGHSDAIIPAQATAPHDHDEDDDYDD
ncbi:MAG TPA: hypothetical protein VIW01_12420 [Dehalococcoidia bacterium]